MASEKGKTTLIVKDKISGISKNIEIEVKGRKKLGITAILSKKTESHVKKVYLPISNDSEKSINRLLLVKVSWLWYS